MAVQVEASPAASWADRFRGQLGQVGQPGAQQVVTPPAPPQATGQQGQPSAPQEQVMSEDDRVRAAGFDPDKLSKSEIIRYLFIDLNVNEPVEIVKWFEEKGIKMTYPHVTQALRNVKEANIHPGSKVWPEGKRPEGLPHVEGSPANLNLTPPAPKPATPAPAPAPVVQNTPVVNPAPVQQNVTPGQPAAVNQIGFTPQDLFNLGMLCEKAGGRDNLLMWLNVLGL